MIELVQYCDANVGFILFILFIQLIIAIVGGVIGGFLSYYTRRK